MATPVFSMYKIASDLRLGGETSKDCVVVHVYPPKKNGGKDFQSPNLDGFFGIKKKR